jgi:RNA polymerase sigma factor (sigma-70 family)
MERSVPFAMHSLRDSISGEIPSSEFAKWTRAIARGDQNAFSEFFDQWSPRLFQFLLRLARGDSTLAQEIHQITMIKAARNFRSFATEAELWGWLCKIGRNSFLDHLRRDDVFRRAISLLHETSVQEASPASEADLLCALENAMRSCTLEEKTLFQAIYSQERSHKDVAAELGITPKAVERRLAKAREKLRARIERGQP